MNYRGRPGRILALCVLFGALSASCAQDAGAPAASTGSDGDAASVAVLRSVESRQLYVELGGSDSANGQSLGTALRTIPHALSVAQAGDTILVGAGDWPPVRIVDRRFPDGQPLRIVARGQATIRDDNYDSNAGFFVRNSSNLSIEGFGIRRVLWGIRTENSSNLRILNNHVRDTGQEGIEIKDRSHHVEIVGNRIHNTGNRSGAIGPFPAGQAPGEGIYIGQGSGGENDNVHDIRIANNEIYDTNHEAIDIKRPSWNIVIEDNNIHDIHTYTSGAVVVHIGTYSSGDPNIVIRRNSIRNVTRTSQYNDGNCIALSAAATVENNLLFNCQHRAVYVDENFPNSANRNVRILHNTVFNPGSRGAIEVHRNSNASVTSAGNLGLVYGSSDRAASASFFVNAAAGDFRLTDSAPLEQAPVGLVSDDFTGTPRPRSGHVDHGAYQKSSGSVAITTTSKPPSTTSTSTTSTSTSTTSPIASSTTQVPNPTSTVVSSTTDGRNVTSTTSGTSSTTSTPGRNPNSSTTTPRSAPSSTVPDRRPPTSPPGSVGSPTPSPTPSPSGANASPTTSTALTPTPTPPWCDQLEDLCETFAPLM